MIFQRVDGDDPQVVDVDFPGDRQTIRALLRKLFRRPIFCSSVTSSGWSLPGGRPQMMREPPSVFTTKRSSSYTTSAVARAGNLDRAKLPLVPVGKQDNGQTRGSGDSFIAPRFADHGQRGSRHAGHLRVEINVRWREVTRRQQNSFSINRIEPVTDTDHGDGFAIIERNLDTCRNRNTNGDWFLHPGMSFEGGCYLCSEVWIQYRNLVGKV